MNCVFQNTLESYSFCVLLLMLICGLIVYCYPVYVNANCWVFVFCDLNNYIFVNFVRWIFLEPYIYLPNFSWVNRDVTIGGLSGIRFLLLILTLLIDIAFDLEFAIDI